MRDFARLRRHLCFQISITLILFVTFTIVHYNWAQPLECSSSTECHTYNCIANYCDCVEANFTELFDNGQLTQSRPWRCDTTETEVKPYGWAQITALVILSVGFVVATFTYGYSLRYCQCSLHCRCDKGCSPLSCKCSFDCPCNYEIETDDHCGCQGCATLMKNVTTVLHNPTAWLSYKCTCHHACFNGCKCFRGVTCKEPRRVKQPKTLRSDGEPIEVDGFKKDE
jgi:hypothetical protein